MTKKENPKQSTPKPKQPKTKTEFIKPIWMELSHHQIHQITPALKWTLEGCWEITPCFLLHFKDLHFVLG